MDAILTLLSTSNKVGWPDAHGEGALPRAAEEHGSSADAVCAVESLDGAQDADGAEGSSPSEDGVKALEDASKQLPKAIAASIC